MKNYFVRLGLALAAAAFLLVVAPPVVEAQWSTDSLAPEPAAVRVLGAGVELFPTVSYKEAVLTVSRGDTIFTRVFEANERPTIERVGPDGEPLADGVYRWELQLRPDDATARELRKAAAENGGKAPGAWRAQSGSFAIQGGNFVSPEVDEPGALHENAAPVFSTGVPSRTWSRSAARDAVDFDGSRVSEADFEAASRSQANASSRAGLGIVSGINYPDSDGNAAALTPSLSKSASAAAAAAKAAAPHRTHEPGGTNGRPEKEED